MSQPSDNPYAAPTELGEDENQEWPIKIGPPYWPAVTFVLIALGLFAAGVALAREFGVWLGTIPTVLLFAAFATAAEGIRRWWWAGVHCLAGPRGILAVRVGVLIPWASVASLRIKDLPAPGGREWSSIDTCLIITIKPDVFDDGTQMLQYYMAQRTLVRYYGLAGASAARKQELGLPLFGLEPDFVSSNLIPRLGALGHIGPTIGPPPGAS